VWCHNSRAHHLSGFFHRWREPAIPDVDWMIEPRARIRGRVLRRRASHFRAGGKYFGSGGNCPFLVGIKYPSQLTR
jgi:hypothetical protein